MSATRIAATVSFAVLALSACAAAPPNAQELALIDSAMSPILPATQAERDKHGWTRW